MKIDIKLLKILILIIKNNDNKYEIDIIKISFFLLISTFSLLNLLLNKYLILI